MDNTDNVAYTRESLLADWAALGSAMPLCVELENLLLKHMNRPRQNEDQRFEQSLQTQYVHDSCPPPSRFQRRKTARAGQVEVPLGPSFSCEIGCVKSASFAPPPAGPRDASPLA